MNARTRHRNRGSDRGGAYASGASTGHPPGSLLVVDGLGYSYPNGTEALRDVTLSIAPGRNVALIGPSGCGKSTFLQVLAGLSAPTAGSVSWDYGGSRARHHLSMMFQKDTLLPWLTVRKNISLYYRYRGERGKAIDPHIDDLLRIGGLREAAERYPYQLSGGMRRRAQFLSSIAPNPAMLLLDEPFSSLDEPTRILLHQDVFNISQELQMSMVLVTHDLAEAISLADEIVVLTQRPARISTIHTVPFGPRRDMFGLRENPEFLKLYGKIWHDLNEEIKLGGTVPPANRAVSQ